MSNYIFKFINTDRPSENRKYPYKREDLMDHVGIVCNVNSMEQLFWKIDELGFDPHTVQIKKIAPNTCVALTNSVEFVTLKESIQEAYMDDDEMYEDYPKEKVDSCELTQVMDVCGETFCERAHDILDSDNQWFELDGNSFESAEHTINMFKTGLL